MRWGNRGTVSAVQHGESMKLPSSEQVVSLHLTDSHPTPRSAFHGSSLQTVRAVIVIGALGMVFELDRMTASAPVQHLYYVPIIFGGLWFRRWGGVMAAGAAIVLYHLANPHLLTFRYEESDFVQISLFVAVGLVTAKLARDAHRLRTLATTDDLTGLHNLRSFEAHLASIVREARATETPVSMIVLDIDRLKSMNDRHGHLAGSEAVREVGRIIAVTVPRDAVACRYGGDEFVIALPHCGEPRAKQIASALRDSVHASEPTLAGILFPAGTLSVSVGVASRRLFRGVRRAPDGGVEGGEALFRAADTALYEAKHGGRNYVSVA
jgi:diguanylate cyclase (GGDEF)-like protein